MSFWNYRLLNTCLCKCLKSHVSLHPRTVNMLRGPKHCCNLQDYQLYQLCLSLWENFSGKNPFLVISEILQPLLNTSIPDEKYFAGNRENVPEAIQIQWSKKVKIFYQHVTAFLKPTFSFKHFRKKYNSHRLSLFEIIDYEIRAYVNV